MTDALKRQSCVSLHPSADVYVVPEDEVSKPPPCEKAFRPDAFTLAGNSFSKALSALQGMKWHERIACTSGGLLGAAYGDDPLGEGFGAGVDTDPKFSLRFLDCMTYVEEVLALAQSESQEAFEENLACIRYRDCVPTYAMRNHHVEDWVLQNTKRGLLRDITREVGGDLAVRANVTVDFMWWIGKKKLPRSQKQEIHNERRARHLDQPTPVAFDYIPLSALLAFDPTWQEHDPLPVDRLPETSILLIIGKKEDEAKYSTRVRHMGIIIRPRTHDGSLGEPRLRHCTPKEGCIERPLLPYLASQLSTREGVRIIGFVEE